MGRGAMEEERGRVEAEEQWEEKGAEGAAMAGAGATGETEEATTKEWSNKPCQGGWIPKEPHTQTVHTILTNHNKS